MFPGKRLCLEIGCGKGRFTIGMAELYPEKAFIGIETQHDIAYYPGKAAKDKQLDNVRIICADAENLLEWFEPGEIKELYLNFSDPRLAMRSVACPIIAFWKNMPSFWVREGACASRPIIGAYSIFLWRSLRPLA